MTPWQVSRQLRFILRGRFWEDNPAFEKVLDARVTGGPQEAAYALLTLPFVLITPLGGPSDDEEPGLHSETFRILIVQGVEGDDIGEFSMIGAARADGQEGSAGRGVLEIEEEVAAALDYLDTEDGIENDIRRRETREPVLDDNLGYIVGRALTTEARCTASRFYHPTTRFLAVDAAGGGDADLTWSLPPARYDRLRIIVRRAAGSTPPATPTSGTGIALAGDLVTAHTDDPGVGTFSYSIFVGYLENIADEDAPPTAGSPDRFSAAQSATVVVT